jgi:hypothetical protein
LKHWNDGTQYNEQELLEELAWVTIEAEGWVPTPLLLMWLTKYIDEVVDCKAALQQASLE